ADDPWGADGGGGAEGRELPSAPGGLPGRGPAAGEPESEPPVAAAPAAQAAGAAQDPRPDRRTESLDPKQPWSSRLIDPLLTLHATLDRLHHRPSLIRARSHSMPISRRAVLKGFGAAGGIPFQITSAGATTEEPLRV